ncbi:MFS transporter [Streptomyces sp. NPDC094472]|uniref:MFS transporter n=1 Tax=Streptomyces sp. NPDC094472 TaxID=3155080 RepID=UPI00332ED2C0
METPRVSQPSSQTERQSHQSLPSATGSSTRREHDFVLNESQSAEKRRSEWTRAPLELVDRRRLASTVLLWIAVMLNLAVFYAVQSWLPKILSRFNHIPSTAVAATAATTLGGIAAAALIGTMMHKRSAFGMLGVVYLIGAVFIAGFAFALTHADDTLLVVAAFLTGTCVTGGQMSVIALTTQLYPLWIRPTGVGWALGVGRVGGILGPLLVGFALSDGVTAETVFLVMGCGLLLASAVVFGLSKASASIRLDVPAPQAGQLSSPTSGTVNG